MHTNTYPPYRYIDTYVHDMQAYLQTHTLLIHTYMQTYLQTHTLLIHTYMQTYIQTHTLFIAEIARSVHAATFLVNLPEIDILKSQRHDAFTIKKHQGGTC